jgi:iron complex transport system ATP-binding protein
MLEVKDLSLGYGEHRVLSGITFALRQGELVSVIGANGCGKSTLLKGMLGMLSPDAGESVLEGRPLSEIKRNEIAKSVAYLAQGKNTPDMTVERMVLHGRFPHLAYPRRYGKRDRIIAHAAMEKMGVSSFADTPLATLSGGMRQNAYIAMALAQDTPYILMDEPTTYLDASHALSVMKTLRSLAEEGKGILTVMHDLPLAFAFSDKIIVLKDGKVAAEGTPDEIAASHVVEDSFGVSLSRTETGTYYYNYKNG